MKLITLMLTLWSKEAKRLFKRCLIVLQQKNTWEGNFEYLYEGKVF